jgi:hypothetical protein
VTESVAALQGVGVPAQEPVVDQLQPLPDKQLACAVLLAQVPIAVPLQLPVELDQEHPYDVGQAEELV